MNDTHKTKNGITHIITDIEGTTTAIDFVYKTLFPYARTRLRSFLEQNQSEPAIQAIITQIQTEVAARAEKRAENIEDIADILVSWMDNDQKITPLKALQGHIWQAGYNSGELRGHLYLDAADLLQRWHQAGYQLCVYSSGSVAAQKLLFKHSTYGDLTPLFSHYFDTRIGHKRETSSYQALLTELKASSAHTTEAIHALFLSDVKEELDAAAAAGMETFGIARPTQPNSSTPLKGDELGEHKVDLDFNAVDQWLRQLSH